MIEFIPLKNYYDVYIYFCLFIVVAILLHAYALGLNDQKNLKFLRNAGWLLLVLIIVYLGLRPISFKVFGDMSTYANYFNSFSYLYENVIKIGERSWILFNNIGFIYPANLYYF